MALTIKNLGAVIFNAASKELYMAPTSPARSGLVRNIIMTNTHNSATIFVDIVLTKSSVDYVFRKIQIPAGDTQVIEDEITLASGEAIYGKNSSDTSSKLIVVVNGLERDV